MAINILSNVTAELAFLEAHLIATREQQQVPSLLYKTMEDWLLSVLTVATIEMLLSTTLAGLVIYMTIFKTPPEFKHFSILLLIYSATDAYGGIGGWMTFNQRTGITYSTGLTAYVSYGVCGLVGSYFCFVVEMMNMAPLMFNLTLTTFNMGYRLYLLHKKTPSWKIILPIVIVLAIPWTTLAHHTTTQFAPPEEIRPHFSSEQINLYGNWTVFGQRMNEDWATPFLEAAAYYPVVFCVISLIFRFFIIRSIEKMGRGVSNRNYKLQREIVWVLTIQSCCPLLIMIAIAVFMAAVVAQTTHPIFQTLTYPIMVTTGITDAVVSLYFIVPYRRAIKKWLSVKKKTKVFLSEPPSRISNATN